MARTYKPKTDLGRLDYSPQVNPLLDPVQVVTRKRRVKSGTAETLINPKTGEVRGVSAVYTIEEKDEAEFVKIFASGVSASYDLTKTAQRVFQIVLTEYQKTPMTKGYADSVDLFWYDGGIGGIDVGISEYTFKRGLRELLDKGFLAPKSPTSYWTNPALFFKGDRVMFLREYRRKRKTESDELEDMGQLRLID